MPPEWSHSSNEGSTQSNSNHQQYAEKFLQSLQQLIGEQRYQKWFQNRSTVTIHGDVLVVGVASPFLTQWMSREFQQPATEIARECLGLAAQVRFEVDAAAAEQLSAFQSQVSSSAEVKSVVTTLPHCVNGVSNNGSPVAAPTPIPAVDKNQKIRGRLAPRRRRFASLNDFVTGPGNHVPHAMAKVVAEHPGEQYNPLYFYGGVGIGKTHLLEGIHREVRQNYPDWQVMSLTAEAFGNYYTKALYEKSLPAFRKKFRAVDVLIVDDIDFLDAKKGFQEEFCHTIQELISYGRQVVLAADRHPRMLTHLRPELSTRFLSGLVTRLESPDLETRREIVRRHTTKLSLPVTDDAIDFVATKFSRNVRELIGAINCLQTYHHMTKRMVGITAAREILRDLERDCLKIVRTSDIQHAVCNLFGVQPEDLISAKRSRNLSQPRMLAMYLSRQWTQAAYHEIGKQYGGRNHSTVMSAEKRMKQMLERNESIQISTRKWSAQEIVSTLEEQLQVG